MLRNISLVGLLIASQLVSAAPREDASAKAEHDMIDVGSAKDVASHTAHPDAQWYGDASFGLFIHWGIASVRAMNISWPMIPGRPLGAKRIDDPNERARIIREEDWNLNGKPNAITPNEYWSMAKDFNPQKYDPDKWLKAAKAAGFKYAVLTTRHHEGFALWPSAYGEFNTKNYMGGRDLVKEYVEACRRNGLKVGLYYSPPDWYFDRDYMSFLYHGARKTNPELPPLDADLKVRQGGHTREETEAHQKAFAEEVRGQITELLTNYGKIDLIWFDGKPAIPNGDKVMTAEEMRKLQPGIVINPRLHGKGDFVTYERKMNTSEVAKGWAEFCNTWTTSWSHQEIPFRSNAFVLGELVKARALGINYLLGVGPTRDGEFVDAIYKNMKVVEEWMGTNGEAVLGAHPLANGEKAAGGPATSRGNARYLFALAKFKDGGSFPKDQLPPESVTLTLTGVGRPTRVSLMRTGEALPYQFANGTLSVSVTKERRGELVDVVKVELGASAAN